MPYQLPDYTAPDTKGEHIARQFKSLAQQLADSPNETTALTWGYEIESNTMGEVRANCANDAGLEWQQDGSVTDYYGGDCDCCCDDCNHNCNCDYCDRADYDEHCGNSDCSGTQEVASVGGLTDTHPASLQALADAGINDATYETDCGIHIHIGSAHLTAPQIANIMTAYRLAQPVLNYIAQRVGTHFAQNHTDEHETQARQGLEPSSRYYAVNVANHFKTYGTKTIEFRQMAGSQDTDHETPQADRVRAWAYILRALVTYASQPAPSLYWLTRAKDLNDLLKLIHA